MKKHRPRILTLLLLTSLFPYLKAAESVSFDDLSHYWSVCEKDKVREYAERRLAEDPNDLMGNLLLRECAYEFLEPALMERSTVGLKKCQSEARFSEIKYLHLTFETLESSYQRFNKEFDRLSPEDLIANRAKANIPDKKFMGASVLRSAEADGFNKGIGGSDGKVKTGLNSETTHKTADQMPTEDSPGKNSRRHEVATEPDRPLGLFILMAGGLFAVLLLLLLLVGKLKK